MRCNTLGNAQETYPFVQNIIIFLYANMQSKQMLILTFIGLRSREYGAVFFLHLFYICLYFIYHLPNFFHLHKQTNNYLQLCATVIHKKYTMWTNKDIT